MGVIDYVVMAGILTLAGFAAWGGLRHRKTPGRRCGGCHGCTLPGPQPNCSKKGGL